MRTHCSDYSVQIRFGYMARRHPRLYFHPRIFRPRQPLLFRQALRFRHVPFQRRDFSILDDPEPVVEHKGHEAEHGFSIDRRWR